MSGKGVGGRWGGAELTGKGVVGGIVVGVGGAIIAE